jgi:hypothetical protein
VSPSISAGGQRTISTFCDPHAPWQFSVFLFCCPTPHARRAAQKLRLRSVEHEKEYRQRKTGKCIDEGGEQRHSGRQSSQNIEKVEDERPHRKGRYQHGPNQCQQCRILECHVRIMNAGVVVRKSGEYCICPLSIRGGYLSTRMPFESCRVSAEAGRHEFHRATQASTHPTLVF